MVRLVWNDAFKVPLPNKTLPSRNATLPVGELPVTVAVNVNGVPGSAGVPPLVSTSVVVVEGRMVMVPVPEK